MQEREPFLPPRKAAPEAPAPGRPEAYAVIAGATDQERIEEHIRILRRFTELAFREADRLDRQAEMQAARIEAQAAAAWPEAEPPGTAPPEPERPSGEVSRALFRLARIARYNAVLEQKLIEDLRHPGPRAPGRRGPQKRAEQAAEFDAKKEEAESFVLDAVQSDTRIDRERLEALVEELREGFEDGRFDEALQTMSGEQIGYLYVLDHGVQPDWPLLLSGLPAYGLSGEPAPDWYVERHGAVPQPGAEAAETLRAATLQPETLQPETPRPEPAAAGALSPGAAPAPSSAPGEPAEEAASPEPERSGRDPP